MYVCSVCMCVCMYVCSVCMYVCVCNVCMYGCTLPVGLTEDTISLLSRAMDSGFYLMMSSWR